MILTIQYYVGLGENEKDGQKGARILRLNSTQFQTQQSMSSRQVNFQKQLNLDNELLTQDIYSGTVEIIWWMNKTLAFLQSYRGKCIRFVNLKSTPDQSKYFEPGKVFRWENFTSAFRIENIDQDISQFDKDYRNYDTCFHIFSQTGRLVKDFLYSKQSSDENTVLFGSGTEFLVCKKVFNKEKNRYDIYIREVQLGLGQNVILWTDSNMFKDGGENEENIAQLIKKCWSANIKIILKSSSKTAWAYIYSEFFRISINICKKFKIISNKARRQDLDDQHLLPYKFIDGVERHWHAGPKFLKHFIDGPMKDLKPHINRIDMIMYCGYKNPDDEDEWKHKP